MNLGHVANGIVGQNYASQKLGWVDKCAAEMLWSVGILPKSLGIPAWWSLSIRTIRPWPNLRQAIESARTFHVLGKGGTCSCKYSRSFKKGDKNPSNCDISAKSSIFSKLILFMHPFIQVYAETMQSNDSEQPQLILLTLQTWVVMHASDFKNRCLLISNPTSAGRPTFVQPEKTLCLQVATGPAVEVWQQLPSSNTWSSHWQIWHLSHGCIKTKLSTSMALKAPGGQFKFLLHNLNFILFVPSDSPLCLMILACLVR